jgi:Zn/Cd-binding protein ZinT
VAAALADRIPVSEMIGVAWRVHTDAAREWAYDRKSHIGQLDKGLDEAQVKDWTVVDMNNDWRQVFPFDER